MKKLQKGFTLVELLVVIGILAILTAVVLVAVNPGRQLIQARDTQRKADVNTISSAIIAYIADPSSDGAFPPSIILFGAANMMCPPDLAAADATIGTAGDVNLDADLNPLYIGGIPVDPGNDATNTGYTMCINDVANKRFTVKAPEAEGGTPILVTR